MIHPNHQFLIDVLSKAVGTPARVLDVGCGAGELVRDGLDAGLDMFGADIFYEGGDSRERAKELGLYGERVLEVTADGRLPFDDQSFDAVCSNEVLEHVQDLDLVLSEVRRVLKPNGIFLSIFPTLGVFREGHCGVPFAHWLNPAPRVQSYYLFAGRSLGLGHHKGSKTNWEWAADFSDWLRKYTVYRDKSRIYRAFGACFSSLQRLDAEYLAFRLEHGGSKGLARLARAPLVSLASQEITYRLAGIVIMAK